MQGGAWIGLLRRIPQQQHDCLILMTINGTEIVLQRLIRLDRDFMVVFGRLSGSTDEGKVLVIPYDQLTYLSINKKLTDDEIQTVLGNSDAGIKLTETESAAPVAPPAPATAAKPEPVLASPAPPPAAAAALSSNTMAPGIGNPPDRAIKPPQKASPPSKSILLARLRQRLAEDINKQAK